MCQQSNLNSITQIRVTWCHAVSLGSGRANTDQTIHHPRITRLSTRRAVYRQRARETLSVRAHGCTDKRVSCCLYRERARGLIGEEEGGEEGGEGGGSE